MTCNMTAVTSMEKYMQSQNNHHSDKLKIVKVSIFYSTLNTHREIQQTQQKITQSRIPKSYLFLFCLCMLFPLVCVFITMPQDSTWPRKWCHPLKTRRVVYPRPHDSFICQLYLTWHLHMFGQKTYCFNTGCTQFISNSLCELWAILSKEAKIIQRNL